MLHTTNATNDAPVLTFFDAKDIYHDEILLMFVKCKLLFGFSALIIFFKFKKVLKNMYGT